jgi:F0F1-type ATP synthase assembly protein I
LDLADRQHLYNGAGNGLARAFELAVTPIVFGLLGHLLDRRLGTSPLFLTVLFLVCIVGMGVRMYYGYREAMAAHDLASPWGHGAAAVPNAGGPEGPR